jgi:CheY-like chemotaxis protein
MHKEHKKKILAAIGDLLFTIKVRDTAKKMGLDVEFVKSDKDLLEQAKNKPMLIILDLSFAAIQPLKTIVKLKGNAETKPLSLIGFLPHVEGELKQKAHETGCDMVMARSAFSQNLPQILKRHAGFH